MKPVLPVIEDIGVAPQFVSLSLLMYYTCEDTWGLIDFVRDLRNEENQ